MIVSAHQPNFLPYLGFFDKMIKSDVFIIFDDAQFTDTEYFHRNRIRIPTGWKWLTVPTFKERCPINSVRINNEASTKARYCWNEMHFREIHNNYKKTPYYDVYADELKAIYQKKYDRLVDLNMRIIEFLIDAFEIEVEVRFTSELQLQSSSTEKILDAVHAVGGDTYLSGIGGHNYLDESLFKDIELRFQYYKHPVYEQRFSDFIPNMSAIDALFNMGKVPCCKPLK
ncbi:WbqC family protein [Methanococcoides sp. NM1]|uniref:WbqC family protein n=1 Tax=Methanococcoides sp. NM1 TaxID=1201013 RepID=UPI001083F9C9|nr:WbqC family protein [Methanococcoides sp. NM1]